MKTILIGALFAAFVVLPGATAAQDLELPPLDVPPAEAPVESQTLPPLQIDPDSLPSDGFDPDTLYVDPGVDAVPADPSSPLPAAPVEGQPAPAIELPRVKNKVAEFSGIDKITGRITTFDVDVDETVQFGALQVTPRICYTSPPSAPPKTDSFVEVDEITLDREIKRIFTGWMFSDSPGLNAVEHPIYDVWLKGCKTDSAAPAPAG